MDTNKASGISHAETDEKIGEFWDTHDFTEFDNPDAADVEFEITCNVPLDPDLFTALEKQARQRGVQVETLVNLWLQQKLAEHVGQAV
jgi:hypothetical protein